MTIPSLIFGVLVASAYACIFHLLRGGNIFELFVYIIVSNAGFFFGNWIGWLIGRLVVPIGVISFTWASLFSLGLLLLAGALSNPL